MPGTLFEQGKTSPGTLDRNCYPRPLSVILQFLSPNYFKSQSEKPGNMGELK